MSNGRRKGDDLQAQRDYVAELEAAGFGYDLAIGDAFVRGMRDIGYKSTSYAGAEIADNAIQAGASRFDVLLHGPDGGINELAMIDNGHGMEPKMLRLALIWGAGHRGERRDGMGKYGYGLPSASVSQAERVEVYSKIADSTWHRAYLDIIEIRDGKWLVGNRIQMPEPLETEPPKYVQQFISKQYPDGFKSGTVVIWQRADRLDKQRRAAVRNQLLTDLGVIYRNHLRNTAMSVDAVEVEPCDPLFLTAGARYYDIDEDRAVALPAATLDVTDKGTGEVIGQMRVRFARFPATFFRLPDFKRTNKPGKEGVNERLPVAEKHNGIIFLRAGRQIDVVRPLKESGLQSFNATTDRFWAVEVDFDPALDSEFRITTSKQQVVPSERVWDILNDKAGLRNAIGQMRSDYDKEAAQVRAESEEAKKRASVEVKERSEKHKTTKPAEPTREQQQQAEAAKEREVKRRAKESHVPEEQVRRELEAEQQDNPFAVETEALPGAPFYRPEQRGAQKVLYLNTEHAFYTDVYAGPEATPRLRAALELLLWTLAESELDAPDERRRFYARERSLWSDTLTTDLDLLRGVQVIDQPLPSVEDAA